MSDKASVDTEGDDCETLSTASGGATASSNKNKADYPGPLPNVKYPLNVLYCGGMYFKLKFL